MAETLISPGVLARENDNSFVTQQPVTVGASIIGPTVKGPVEIPTVVTTYSDYLNRFGGGNIICQAYRHKDDAITQYTHQNHLALQ